MPHEDVDYFQRRAEQEIELAQLAENSCAVQAHYEIASTYLDRVYGDHPEAGKPVLDG